MSELDFNVDLMKSVLWQYEGSPNIKALAQNDQDYINSAHSQFWKDWIRDVFNLKTANRFGLSVWARILDVPLTIRRPQRLTGVFGFGANHKNFGNGSFGRATAAEQKVTPETARQILLLRWAQLTMRPTVPNINLALEIAFGPDVAYVRDNQDMSYAVFLFTQAPNYRVVDILRNLDILPRPSTVGAEWSLAVPDHWGFGQDRVNFGRGGYAKREEL